MFFHLSNHSTYSLQEGLSSPSELVQAAQAQNLPALGLTDHRLLTGSVEFVHACKEAGIQPILGLEIDLETGKLALFATSMKGWSNLCRLSSALALRDDPEAACSLEALEPYSKGLVALSGTCFQRPTLPDLTRPIRRLATCQHFSTDESPNGRDTPGLLPDARSSEPATHPDRYPTQ
jgi:DNA polymerase III alpha subunit